MNKRVVLWARMTGFPYWPARLCTVFEESNLRAKTGKLKQVAVSFLGLKRDSGWVPDAGIAPFTVDSMNDKFSMKKFRSDKDYRAAVIECIRILSAIGEVFPPNIMEAVAHYNEEFPFSPTSSCLKCSGTEHSGSLMQCANCFVTELHWHCHRMDDSEPLTGSWLCDKCCVIHGLPSGSLLPFENEPENSANSESVVSAPVATISSNKKQKLSSLDENDGYSNHVLFKLKSQKGLVDDNPPEVKPQLNLSEDLSVEDFCFVCGQDGKLLVCDFPGCIKVYHQMCIIKRSASTVFDDNKNDEECDGLNDETFFCPRHNCIMCSAIENTSCSLTSMDLPLSYYTMNSDGVQAPSKLTQKPLKSCTKCPFSICKECESEICQSKSVFQIKRVERLTEDLVCLNCSSNNVTLKLARVLEVAWMRMCSSRLALPFMRPLLPVINYDITSTTTNSYDVNEMDLITLLDKIRQLKYDSLKSFHKDLNIMRNILVNKIRSIVTESPESSKQFMETDDNYKSIIGSFDSIVDSCSNYLRSKEVCLPSSKIDGENDDSDDSEANYWNPTEETTTSDDNTGDSRDVVLLSKKRLRNDLEAEVVDNEHNIMLRLWRKECSRNSTSVDLAVTPRTLMVWAAYLREGELQTKFRGPDDPWSLSAMIAQNDKLYSTNQLAKIRAKELLAEAHDYSDIMNNELLAANFMIDMKQSCARESVSLFEEYRVNENGSACRRNGARIDEGNGMRDDTLVVLDRLREVTQKASQLETRLREDFFSKQRSLTQCKESLSIGETGILKELKLANDNLRWKLKYKSEVIAASQSIIAELKRNLKEKDEEIEKLKSQLKV